MGNRGRGHAEHIVGGPADDASGGDDAATVLAVFGDSQRAVRVEEARQIGLAARYASFHEVDHDTNAASLVDEAPGGEGELLLGGDGCPWISEFSVVEFAAATGRSTQAARTFLGTALELVHRLPLTWAQVRSGHVEGWRARRVAEATMTLPREAAVWVDSELVGRVQKVGVRTLDGLVAEALARFDPEQALEDETDVLAGRHVTVHHGDSSSRAATMEVTAVLDTTDALALDALLDEIADLLPTVEGPAGILETKNIRRSKALGMLARGQVHFPPHADQSDSDGVGEPGPQVRVTPTEVVLHVRVAEGDTVATVHTLTGHLLGLVTVALLQAWCGHSQVVVKPILDLTTEAVSSGRFPSPSVRDHVVETARCCVFPYCERRAEACDLDHVTPYDTAGPPGQTRSGNLAPLCRLHHRVKTFTGWRYDQTTPGTYHWTSPHGHRYRVTRHGTEGLDTSANPRAA